ncbi:MAG: recombinase family protein [Alphaproteobacteria bacterium]|nr:recombinase family protein [Alphaproteobacteria bacterium]
MKNVENWLEEWIDNDSNQAKTKERAVIYYVARKSVSKNIIDVLVNYCSDKSLKIIKVYNLAVCSKRGLKKSLFNMLSFINTQKGRIHVVCNDFYDIFQDVRDLQTLEPYITMGKLIIHILKQDFIIDKNNYNTEMRVRINAMFLMKYYYINSLSRNIKASQQHFISNGRCMYLAPIGYKNVRDASGYADVVVDTIKAPIITKLFKEYSTGSYSIKTLTELAHTLGLKNRNGALVSETCINDMLKNKFYIGMQRWNQTLYPHKYPTIIDKHLFDKVQEVLMEHTC